MGIFSGLEALGFKNSDRAVYEEEEKEVKKEVVQEKKPAPAPTEEDMLFPKTYKCPVCEESFKSLSVRAGKARSIGQDSDLRPKYSGIDPIKYDAVVCNKCGYSALSRYYDYVMPLQRKKLKEEVVPTFKGMEVSLDKYPYDEAILRYKMVLMCDVVGGVPNSRKAYTCLKMAWVIRGKLEAEADSMDENAKKQLMEDEKECLANAYDGFTKAFSSEKFPMSGMDEMTLSYLLADLGYELGHYQEALRMLANILSNQSVSSRIKDKALLLKESIREKYTEDA